MRKIILITLFFLIPAGSFAQTKAPEYALDILNRFVIQSNLFPQEKIHLHIDKPSYVAGERIWFRAHVANALTHEPIFISRYVYVELVNPLARVITRVKVRNQEDCYSGYIQIPENLAEGNYSLRAYTAFMENLDEGYFYRTAIPISNPENLRYDIELSYRYSDKDRVEVILALSGMGTDKKISRRDFDIKYCDVPVGTISSTSDSSLRFTVKTTKDEPARTLYVEYGTFRKYFHIPFPQHEFDVSFFPEGGNLITGSQCRVAFKSVRPDGSPVNIEGEILNSDRELIARLETLDRGMGSFVITPVEGEKYFALCQTPEGFLLEKELPSHTSKALSLSLSMDPETLLVQIAGNPPPEIGKLYMLAHSRGRPVFIETITPATGKSFPIGELPAGVVHFLLIDDNYNILSERLYYSGNNSESIRPEITSDKPAYTRRDRIRLSIQLPEDVTDASMSMSVTDDSDVKATDSGSIFAHMLLSSELKGYIHEPDYFLQTQNQAQMDLLMMVHGWRRYNLPEMLKGNYSEPDEPLEVGQEISGSVRTLFRKRPVVDTEVSVISTDQSFYQQTVTDETGVFRLKNFEFKDSTTYIVQALNAKGETVVELILDEINYPLVNETIYPLTRTSNDQYIIKSDRKYVMDNGMRVVDLEGITVTTQRPASESDPMGYMSQVADKSFGLKEIEEIDATCLHELLRRIPGVEIYNEKIYIRGAISIYGHPTAAIFIDGIYVEEDFDIHVIEMPNVARVDVFKTGAAAVFGSRGGAGVVSVTTKSGNFLRSGQPQYNIKGLTPLGFQTPAEFYSPSYDTYQALNDPKPDLRTTLFWKPVIGTDENGFRTVEFYSADFTTSYTVIVEGLDKEGSILRGVSQIKVE